MIRMPFSSPLSIRIQFNLTLLYFPIELYFVCKAQTHTTHKHWSVLVTATKPNSHSYRDCEFCTNNNLSHRNCKRLINVIMGRQENVVVFIIIKSFYIIKIWFPLNLLKLYFGELSRCWMLSMPLLHLNYNAIVLKLTLMSHTHTHTCTHLIYHCSIFHCYGC